MLGVVGGAADGRTHLELGPSPSFAMPLPPAALPSSSLCLSPPSHRWYPLFYLSTPSLVPVASVFFSLLGVLIAPLSLYAEAARDLSLCMQRVGSVPPSAQPPLGHTLLLHLYLSPSYASLSLSCTLYLSNCNGADGYAHSGLSLSSQSSLSLPRPQSSLSLSALTYLSLYLMRRLYLCAFRSGARAGARADRVCDSAGQLVAAPSSRPLPSHTPKLSLIPPHWACGGREEGVGGYVGSLALRTRPSPT